MIRIKKYDFENIKDRITAAECLQNSGEDKECEIILKALAEDINND